MSDFVETQEAAWKAIHDRFKVNETANGPGSTMANTAAVREELPAILVRYKITSMLDAPCGSWNWMRHVDLTGVCYTGWDVQREFINANQDQYGHHTFRQVNLLTVGSVPRVDLILCRDFLIHLPNPQVQHVLDTFLVSGSRYLLTTTRPGADNTRPCPSEGHDDRPGYWHHPLDLEAPPFDLKGRLEAIPEYGNHELCLFDLDQNR